MYARVYVYRPKVQSFFHLVSIETNSLTEPDAHQFWPVLLDAFSPGNPLSSASQVLGLQVAMAWL